MTENGRPTPHRRPGQDCRHGAAGRQQTCAACGGRFRPGEVTDLEPLIDRGVRYIAVHAGHSTFPHRAHSAAA